VWTRGEPVCVRAHGLVDGTWERYNGLRVPHLRDGGSRIQLWLAHLFTACLQAQQAPAAWGLVRIVPVFKSGSTTDPINYRPIAVASVVYRLFAKVINARLVAALEEAALLPPTQFGFRPHKDTRAPLFILRAITDWCASRARSCFLASLDISKAYDTVCHEVLFARLLRLGLPQQLVGLLQHCYGTTTYQAQVNGLLTQPVPVGAGLKQGCPLSPTLFNLYVMHLPQELRARCAGLGVSCGGAFSPVLQLLMYADDMALLASSQRDLTTLLHTLEGLLADLGLHLNIGKCSVLPISRPAIPLSSVHVFSAGGQPVPVVSEAKYLGLMLHRQPRDNRSCRWLSGRLPKCAAAASAFIVHARRADLHHSTHGFLAAMRGLLNSKCLYGAAIWGPRFAADSDIFSCPLQLSLNRVLRSLHHLPVSTPRPALLMHYGQWPLHYHIVQHVVRFYNGVLVPAHDGVLQQAWSLQQSLAWYPASWVGQCLAMLQGYLPQHLADRCMDLLTHLRPLPWATLRQHLQQAYSSRFVSAQDPFADPDCEHRRVATAAVLHAHHHWGELPWHHCHVTWPYSTHMALARFFTTVTPLGIRRHSTPFCQRLCPLCTLHAVQSEQHVLLECPALSPLRHAAPLLDWSHHELKGFLRVNWYKADLFGYIAKLAQRLQQYVDDLTNP